MLLGNLRALRLRHLTNDRVKIAMGRGIEQPGPVHENELLNALDGEEVELVHEFVAMHGHGATGEVDATEGSGCASRT